MVSTISHYPELLEHDCVRESFVAYIEERLRDQDYDDYPVRALLDALGERHARSPIAGAIPVLERIASSDLSWASRAALRLFQWGVPGSKERLAELLDQGCWAYHWSAKERAELPEDLRARMAARE